MHLHCIWKAKALHLHKVCIPQKALFFKGFWHFVIFEFEKSLCASSKRVLHELLQLKLLTTINKK